MPLVYKEWKENHSLSFKMLFYWFAYGMLACLIMFFVPLYGYQYMGTSALKGSLDNNMQTNFLCSFTILVFSH